MKTKTYYTPTSLWKAIMSMDNPQILCIKKVDHYSGHCVTLKEGK